MAEDKVTLQIEVDAKDAQSAIELFGKEATQVVKKTEKSIESMKSSFSDVAAGVGVAVAAIGSFGKAIGEAVEGEKAVRQLSLAIAGTGEFSREAVEGLTAYSESLSEITGIDDDVINGALTLAKSFGVTNDQAKELVTAATNLSAVTGQDLDSAVKQLGGTFDGTLGKIANLGPEFRNLTKEQIENGAAIDLINQKYGDAAAALGDSFEGSLNRLQNTINDSFKAIGQQILGDKSIRDGIEQIGKAVLALTPIVSYVAKFIIEGFKTIATGITTIVGIATSGLAELADLVGATGVAKSLNQLSASTLEASIGLAKTLGRFEDANKEASKFDKTLENISKNAPKAGNNAGKAAEKAAMEFKKAKEEAQKFIDTLIKNSGSEVDVLGKKAGEQFKKIQEYQDRNLITFEQAERARIAVADEVNEKILKITTDRYKQEREQLDKQIEAEKKAAQEREGYATSGINFGTQALSGQNTRESQFSTLGSGLGAVLSIWLGPLGGALANFVTQIAQNGKERNKELISGLVKAAPEFVIAFIDGIPGIVDGILDSLLDGNYWLRLGEALGKGFFAWIAPPFAYLASRLSADQRELLKEGFIRFHQVQIDFLQMLGEKVSSFFTEAFGRLGTNIRDAFYQPINDFRNMLTGAFSSIPDLFGNAGKRVADAMLAPINKLIDFLKGFSFGGLGGGGGGGVIGQVGAVITSAGKALGFARGGLVPAYAAGGMFVPRGSDTVPAMLSPGELVVPTDMVGQLGTYLDAKTSNGVTQDTAILTAILGALQSPMVVSAEAKVNEQTFADIILQLNRQNARLA